MPCSMASRSLRMSSTWIQSIWAAKRLTAGPVSYTHLDVYKRQLLYIPASREALDKWNFADYTDSKTGEVTYSAKEQRDDFWAYINEGLQNLSHTLVLRK